MNRPCKIVFPKSSLRAQLDEAIAIKTEMLKMLRELEEQATGRPVTAPGAWRHDPVGWARKNRLK